MNFNCTESQNLNNLSLSNKMRQFYKNSCRIEYTDNQEMAQVK